MAGKEKAARNLVKRGIRNLLVIGGNGSITGAQKLKELWPKIVANLVKRGNNLVFNFSRRGASFVGFRCGG